MEGEAFLNELEITRREIRKEEIGVIKYFPSQGVYRNTPSQLMSYSD